MKLKTVTRLALGLGAAAAAATFLVPEAPAVQAATRAKTAVAKPTLRPTASLPKPNTNLSLTPQQRQDFLKRIAPKLGSGLVSNRLARKLGMKALMGKRLDRVRPHVKSGPTLRNGIDTQVSGDYYGWYGDQNEPSIAVNPLDPDIVVVGAHNDINYQGTLNACSIYISYDGGQTFSYDSDVDLFTDPVTLTNNFCSDTVVRFSPDGFYLTVSYIDYDYVNDIDNIRVEQRDGLFPSIVYGQATPFPGGTAFVDKNWHDVHTFDAADGTADGGNYVYATTTFFGDVDGDTAADDCAILFNWSTDYGATWSTPVTLQQSLNCNDPNNPTPRVIQGSRPAGGPAQQLLACWYDSGADGWAPGDGSTISNRFNIECVSSNDRGATISTPFFASINIPYELSYYLGPVDPLTGFNKFHRWWGGMFPSLVIDPVANAHIVFTADPNSNETDAEAGNVYYTRNLKPAIVPPYSTTWSGRAAIGTGSLAQGWPTVAAQYVPSSLKPYIYVAYADHFRSSTLGTANKNLVYDVRYRRSIVGGGSFQGPVLVTDQSSRSDYVFIGDYFDSGATRRYHVVWTDRADKFSIFDYEDDIYTDRY